MKIKAQKWNSEIKISQRQLSCMCKNKIENKNHKTIKKKAESLIMSKNEEEKY